MAKVREFDDGFIVPPVFGTDRQKKLGEASDEHSAIYSLTYFLSCHAKEFAIFGSQFTYRGEYGRALFYINLAIALNSYDFMTHYNRAVCHLELDNLTSALKDAVTCIKFDREGSKGFFVLGTVLSRLKHHVEAEMVYQKALRLDPENQEIKHHIIGNIYDALIKMEYDPIKAGYASQKYSSIKEAIIFLKNNEFEIDLRITRERKKRNLKKLASKVGRLIPLNFF